MFVQCPDIPLYDMNMPHNPDVDNMNKIDDLDIRVVYTSVGGVLRLTVI